MILVCSGDCGGNINTLDRDRGGYVLVQFCVEGVGIYDGDTLNKTGVWLSLEGSERLEQ